MKTGLNETRLSGTIKWGKLQDTSKGGHKFTAKMSIPFEFKDAGTGEMKGGANYIKICAWNELAVELADIPEESPVEILGRINERSYDGNCKKCAAEEKKYWTDVTVLNYSTLGEGS